MLIFWPIMLFSSAQKIPNNTPEVYLKFPIYYNIIIAKLTKTDMRRLMQLHYHRVQAFQLLFYMCSDSKVGIPADSSTLYESITCS